MSEVVAIMRQTWLSLWPAWLKLGVVESSTTKFLPTTTTISGASIFPFSRHTLTFWSFRVWVTAWLHSSWNYIDDRPWVLDSRHLYVWLFNTVGVVTVTPLPTLGIAVCTWKFYFWVCERDNAPLCVILTCNAWELAGLQVRLGVTGTSKVGSHWWLLNPAMGDVKLVAVHPLVEWLSGFTHILETTLITLDLLHVEPHPYTWNWLRLVQFLVTYQTVNDGIVFE